jgi:hypothetical protein
MENKIEKMKKRIETLIERANKEFTGEWNKSHKLKIARIDGCLDMLSILTDKEYYYDENGLHERN